MIDLAGYDRMKGIGQSTYTSGFSAKPSGLVTAGVISGLTNIATTYMGAKRVKSTYDFNASMARVQGRAVRLKADVEIKNIRKKAQALYGEQQAAYAARGVKRTGSPAAVMMDSMREAELDAIYADISANYNVSLTRTQESIYKAEGKSAMRDVVPHAFKTILDMGVKKYERG